MNTLWMWTNIVQMAQVKQTSCYLALNLCFPCWKLRVAHLFCGTLDRKRFVGKQETTSAWILLCFLLQAVQAQLHRMLLATGMSIGSTSNTWSRLNHGDIQCTSAQTLWWEHSMTGLVIDVNNSTVWRIFSTLYEQCVQEDELLFSGAANSPFYNQFFFNKVLTKIQSCCLTVPFIAPYWDVQFVQLPLRWRWINW